MAGEQHRRLAIQALEDYRLQQPQPSPGTAACVADTLTDHVLDVLATQERAEEALRARSRTVDCRDLFAAAALTGLLADSNVRDGNQLHDACAWAWEYAREMMKGRGGGNG